jgi:hypothetical protein
LNFLKKKQPKGAERKVVQRMDKDSGSLGKASKRREGKSNLAQAQQSDAPRDLRSAPETYSRFPPVPGKMPEVMQMPDARRTEKIAGPAVPVICDFQDTGSWMGVEAICNCTATRDGEAAF